MEALGVIDMQNDFMLPGAPLQIEGAEDIVGPVNRLLREFCNKHSYVFATRDWHPANHTSFQKWPPHCVANTKGAHFHPSLFNFYFESIFDKGTDNKSDGYSGVEGTQLVNALKVRGVDKVYLVGVATEYCVKATALDLIKAGFKVCIIRNCVRGVSEETGLAALEEMSAAGVEYV